MQVKRKQLIGLVIIFLLLLPVVIEGVRTSSRFLKSGRDSLANINLEAIREAQEQYRSANGRYGTLEELTALKLIHLPSDADRKSNHNYWVSDLSPTTFCAHADRRDEDKSYRDFNMSEDGVLHWVESEIKGSVPRGKGMTYEDLRRDN